jgi:hypothetical protein
MSMLGLYARIKRRDRPVRVEEPASRSAHEQEDLTRAIHAKVSLSRNQCCGSASVGPLVRGTDPCRSADPGPSVIKQK